MTILYLSPVHPLMTEGKPLPRWQTQASHVRSLGTLGHDVAVVRYAPRKLGRPSLVQRICGNFKVLGRSVRSENVDVVMLSLGADVLLPVTIRVLLARAHAPLIILSGVSPIRQGNPRERALASLASLVATNDPSHAKEWMSLGARRAVVLPLSAIDPELHYSRPGIRRDLDVVFAGTITDDRREFVEALRQILPASVSLVVKEDVFEEEYAMLLSRATIAINPLRQTMKRGANLRLFEIPAFGAMELSSFSNDEWLVPGKEIVTYGSPKDAAEKILYYLKYPRERERITKAGWRRVMREHTFTHRFRNLIDVL